MGDVERGRITLSDEDRLPWLEAVEDEDDEDGVSLAKLIALVIVALVAIGLVVGGIFWMRRGLQSSSAGGGVIAAPAGDYKVPATDAKGMEVDGLGDASYAASQGENVSSTIDTTRVPERPLTEGMAAAEAAGAQIGSSRIDSRGAAPAAPVRTVPLPSSGTAAAPAAPATRPAPAPAPAKPAPAPTKMASSTPAPSSEPSASAATAEAGPKASKQIGAYSTEAKAEAGRRDLTSRFPALRSLDLTIQEGTSNGKTVYRIFMRGGPARVNAVCAALHSAKEGCIPG